MKFKTVREGEQAVVYDHLGQGRIIVGPERVFLFRKRMQKLLLQTASPDHYLVIEDLSGFLHHKPGPCAMFNNPLEIKSIKVKEATRLDGNEMVVVYKRVKGGDVERRVVRGAAIFVPEAEEWLHEFVWHGEDHANIGRMIPGVRKFHKLAAVPDQFSYNVREVRTNDDTMLTVKLMIFYELKDINTMLETTHDPIADIINAVCADIISFAGKISFPQFLSNTGPLSDVTSYPQLLQRAGRIGYIINKVVYRGYHASDQLQAMQDSAIQSRTQMRIDAELEDQRQKLKDFKLHCEQERTQLRHDMEKNKVDHRQKVDRMKKSHDLALKQLEETTNLQLEDLMTRTRLDIAAASNGEQSEHLQQLRDLDVDLTQFLTNQQAAPVDEHISVVNTCISQSGGNLAQISTQAQRLSVV